LDWYNENINFYHPYCVGTIGKIVNAQGAHVEEALNSPVVKNMLRKYNVLQGIDLEALHRVPEQPVFIQA
jgi:hypothetical protein